MANENCEFDLENDPSVRFGTLLSHPEPGEEIVISGISGVFPLAENVQEFKEKLYRKENMITPVHSTHPDLPSGFGLLKDKSRFDAGFFGIHRRYAQIISPIAKMVLEKTHECLLDAGLNPSDIESTNTGFFLGICFNEFEFYYYLLGNVDDGNPILGNERSAIANMVSNSLKLRGPCVVLDTACSSGGYALEAAYKAIRLGQCDAAIVSARVLSLTGECRPFDEDGLGYVRSEGTVVMLLQKAKDTKRIYAKILHSKTNCDGFKEQGITYPNGLAQYNLVKEIYLESNISPQEVSYIEAHGTGTIAGDPEEMNSVDKIFTPNRTQPLLVGSCKSSIGHTEPTSMLCSIVKVILAFELDLISPNINYKTPRKDLKGIQAGRIKIVVDPTPFQAENGLAGINNFGFGGGNVHAILKRNTKLKTNNGKPVDDLPRLVCVSGRTEESVHELLNCIANNFDVEQIALIYNAFRKPIKNQLYRGYVIVSRNGVLSKSVQPYISRRNLTLHFGALTRSSGPLLRELLSLQALKQFKNKTEQFFNKKKVNTDTAMSNPQFFTDLLVQLALAEMLKKLDVTFETVLAQSVGQFISAYFRNSMSLEQVLECAFVIAGYLENGTKFQSSYRFKKGNLEEKKNHIVSEFKQILHPAKITNGYSNSHQETPNQEDLFQALIESPGTVKTRSVLVEVGQTVPCKAKTKLNLTNATELVQVLETLGSLYEYGHQPQIDRLYPQVEFPVSRGTPMICSAIKWKHDKKYFMPSFSEKPKVSVAKTITINLYDDSWASLDGHVIDGRILFPATSYIFLAWTVFSSMKNVNFERCAVIFENCRFLRACTLSTASKLRLNVMIQMSSGHFEITENEVTVMTGFIRDAEQSPKDSNSGVTNGFEDEHCMTRRDIYKELKLRGYNYKDKFKSVIKTNQTATQGLIKWLDEWVPFMDNMLQMQILGQDTRLLYVPTFIERIRIDPEVHLEEVNKLRDIGQQYEERDPGQEEEKTPVDMVVTVNRQSGIIRSGGIELKGLNASSIQRKKTTAIPVLEKYQFVPNFGQLSIKVALRVFMQVALENNCGFKITAVELVDDDSEDDTPLIGPIISEVLDDQPLVQPDVTILTGKNIECDVKVENNTLKEFQDLTVVVGTGLLNKNSVLDEAVRKLKEGGYVISRESRSLDASKVDLSNLELLNVYDTDEEKLVFLRRKSEKEKKRLFVNVSSTSNFDWLEELKVEVVKKDRDVVVWCQDEPLNGLIGLVNCIRKEPECQHVRGLFIVGKSPKFDPSSPFYRQQLDKNFDVNVLMNGSWGTYRHLLLDDINEVENKHCYAYNTVRGDLSSMKWIEGALTKQAQSSNDLIEVYYSALNFKDVMIASGRLNIDVIVSERKEQDFLLGFEYSGKTLSGKRVMGMLRKGTLATMIKADPMLLWNVPDSWTLQDAASVPVVYATCLYAMVVVGRIKKGESILIHSGTGGIGHAAINLCLNMGCTVFTTVGTEEKRAYIKKHFPQVNEKHIGNSRDVTFEQMIMKQTKGKGVDLVLNALTEEKLFSSVRCLATNGRFLEIGKFDLANHNNLDLLTFKRGASYHGIMLDQMLTETNKIKMMLQRLVQKYIDSGAVKPLPTTVFGRNELEPAIRFMTTGRHMGKVIVEIRDEKKTTHPDTFKGIPKYFCDPTKTYVIYGGLGGFGLELADWLVLRGCRKLVLSSRKGVSTGYQTYRINIWESYGCTVKISTQDITTKSGCQALIDESNALAPIDAIFNLAVVLMDAILLNQTKGSFETSFKPKAYATQYLDEVTRISCPDLRDFVVFSSVSCGRGNAGQTNYGMSNSVMERICEKRRNDGYPGLAIQWGAVGDVGLVADLIEDDIVLEIGGTLQQSITSCLQVLDVLLRQNEAAIVSSIVVAEKRSTSSSGNIVEVILNILGIRDTKLVSMHATLAELGMDSMNAVEVKQTLEREYNIMMSANEIRSLTLERLKDLLEEGSSGEDTSVSNVDWNSIIKALLDSEEQTTSCIALKSNLESSKNPPKVILFPGIEGVCFLLGKLIENLQVEAFGVNYISTLQEVSFDQMAQRLLPDIRKLLKPNESFHIIAHSMGSVIALEIASRLEKLGHQGKIVLIDGSPSFVKEMTRQIVEINLEDFVLANTLRIQIGEEETLKVMPDVCKCSTLEDKLKTVMPHIKLTGKMTETFVINSIKAYLTRAKATDYNPTIGKLKSKVWLYKPNLPALKMDGDYELGQYFEHPVEIKIFEGNHTSILENKELAKDIMRHFDGSAAN